jgi:hypothetical protein
MSDKKKLKRITVMEGMETNLHNNLNHGSLLLHGS